MNKLTYREAYDKIIDAYFKNKIEPYNGCACFVGTLLNGDSKWMECRSGYDFTKGDYDSTRGLIILKKKYPYTEDEIVRLERTLLGSIYRLSDGLCHDHNDYEQILFIAMSETLDVLKEIHRSRGEDVDGFPALIKRKIVNHE